MEVSWIQLGQLRRVIHASRCALLLLLRERDRDSRRMEHIACKIKRDRNEDANKKGHTHTYWKNDARCSQDKVDLQDRYVSRPVLHS
jgi:hypothetical protein